MDLFSSACALSNQNYMQEKDTSNLASRMFAVKMVSKELRKKLREKSFLKTMKQNLKPQKYM